MAGPERVAKKAAKGSETILLVDDDEGVLLLRSRYAPSNGYDVLEAPNGPPPRWPPTKEELAQDRYMVLTDMLVMPQMGPGSSWCGSSRRRAPGLKTFVI